MSKSRFHIAKSGKYEGEMVPCHAQKRCRNGSPSEHIILGSVEEARDFQELQLAKEYDGLNEKQREKYRTLNSENFKNVIEDSISKNNLGITVELGEMEEGPLGDGRQRITLSKGDVTSTSYISMEDYSEDALKQFSDLLSDPNVEYSPEADVFNPERTSLEKFDEFERGVESFRELSSALTEEEPHSYGPPLPTHDWDEEMNKLNPSLPRTGVVVSPYSVEALNQDFYPVGSINGTRNRMYRGNLNVEQVGEDLQMSVSAPNGEVLEFSAPAKDFKRMGELYEFISEKIQEKKPNPEESFRDLLREKPASDDPYLKERYTRMLSFQVNKFREDDKYFNAVSGTLLEKPIRM